MAYPAIDSRIQILELFRRTYPSLIHGQAAEMIDSLHSSAEYFQNILEKTSHQKHEYEKIKDLEGEIRVAVQLAEDLLESNIVEIMRERSSQQEEKNNGSKWTIHDEARVLLRDLSQAIDKIDAVRKDLTFECITSANANAHSTGAAEDHFFKTGDCSSPKRASTALLQDIKLSIFKGQLPCEDMPTLAKLPILEVLKLGVDAFHGFPQAEVNLLHPKVRCYIGASL
ncbi:hypothetical protein K7X08_008156 [Anisodus acutangulus]|uniref:Uncharacterized protein n=1 Tax=Anisodus acutangulus TaxID=402998 RepID=A0A9Q1RL47_9SOLA|nr:hypothetical protein K7X08_008156 [Anisodus acutangulus]